MSDLDRVREMLVWYAQGALPEHDRAFVETWLERHVANHPDIAAELAWLRSASGLLQAQARTEAHNAAPELDAGLSALMQRIALDKPRVEAASRTARAPGLLTRWVQWLDGLLGAPGRGMPAMAMGIGAVLVLQTAVIAHLMQAAPAEQAPLSGAAPIGLPLAGGYTVLTVAIEPTANESALRALLQDTGAQLVGGPSALGLYSLSVPTGQLQQATTKLRAATNVISSVQP